MAITIRVSDECWTKLNRMKKPGETFQEVVFRLVKEKEKEEE